MPAHLSTAGALERTVAAQQLRRNLRQGPDGTDAEVLPLPLPARKLQHLLLALPPGGWVPEDVGYSRHRCLDSCACWQK